MSPDSSSEYIKAGWLIDGTGAPATADIIIEIRDGRIQSLRPTGAQSPNDSHHLMDYSVCTLIPGLIDAHVHLALSGTPDKIERERLFSAGYDVIQGVIAGHIQDHMQCGIIAVRDGGDRHGFASHFKNSLRSKSKSSLITKVAGKAWYREGRYGGIVGRPVEDGDTLDASVEKGCAGIDHVKIINSGLNSLRCFGKETPPQFEIREMEETVHKAGLLGLKTMVHANGRAAVKISIDAGCHSIEHGFFMGVRNLEKMAEKRTVWTPTAYTMKAYGQTADSRDVNSSISLRNLAHQMEQIEVARNFGVKIGLGTDSGSPGVLHGKSMVPELKIMTEAGYTIEEAIQCGTSNNAELLGLNDLGSLTKNRQATFVVVHGKPSDLPDSLKTIEAIYIGGHMVYDSGSHCA